MKRYDIESEDSYFNVVAEEYEYGDWVKFEEVEKELYDKDCEIEQLKKAFEKIKRICDVSL